ncbi:MAG: hypothetical protein LBL96_07615 [Clostridiales bacterium]|jgi:hypothetical protein|nr:hypothetical protein [Clostridiales bacterium]
MAIGPNDVLSVEDVLKLLEGVKKSGGGYMARCPAHDDKTPSLHVSEGDDGKILLTCYAGCDAMNDVRPALGLSYTNIMGTAAPRKNKPPVGAVCYCYLGRYVKFRLPDKDKEFRWYD